MFYCLSVYLLPSCCLLACFSLSSSLPPPTSNLFLLLYRGFSLCVSLFFCLLLPPSFSCPLLSPLFFSLPFLSIESTLALAQVSKTWYPVFPNGLKAKTQVLRTPCEAVAFLNPAKSLAGSGWGSEFHTLDRRVERYWKLKYFCCCFVSAKETFLLFYFIFKTRKPGQETRWALKAGERAPRSAALEGEAFSHCFIRHYLNLATCGTFWAR